MDVYIENHNWDIEEIVTTQYEADHQEGVFVIRQSDNDWFLIHIVIEAESRSSRRNAKRTPVKAYLSYVETGVREPC